MFDSSPSGCLISARNIRLYVQAGASNAFEFSVSQGVPDPLLVEGINLRRRDVDLYTVETKRLRLLDDTFWFNVEALAPEKRVNRILHHCSLTLNKLRLERLITFAVDRVVLDGNRADLRTSISLLPRQSSVFERKRGLIAMCVLTQHTPPKAPRMAPRNI